MSVKILPLHIVRDDEISAPNSPHACVVKKSEDHFGDLLQEETIYEDVLRGRDVEM